MFCNVLRGRGYENKRDKRKEKSRKGEERRRRDREEDGEVKFPWPPPH